MTSEDCFSVGKVVREQSTSTFDAEDGTSSLALSSFSVSEQGEPQSPHRLQSSTSLPRDPSVSEQGEPQNPQRLQLLLPRAALHFAPLSLPGDPSVSSEVGEHGSPHRLWLLLPGAALHSTPTSSPGAPTHRRMADLDSTNRFERVGVFAEDLSCASTSVPESPESTASSDESIGWIPDPLLTVPAIPDSWGDA